MNIKDIAAAAGVSKSTVSRVLTNKGYVSEGARKKIEAAIAAHGYQPSASAQSLSKRETNTIGVIVPEIDNAFFSDVLRGITGVVDQHNLTLIYCNTDNNAEKEMRALEMLESQRVRGVIMTPAVDYSEPNAADVLCTRLKKLGAPVVLVDREIEGFVCDSVLFENYGSAYAATKALIEAGNKKIGIITGDLELKIARDRFEGFCQALKDSGISLLKDAIYQGDFQIDTAYRLALQIFDRVDPLDAILTSNNRTTLGLFKAAHERGKVIGRDIATIGIDSIEVLEMIGYPYSCISRDAVGMGRQAMCLLLDRLEHPQKEQSVCMTSFQLIRRGSECRIKKK